jgi:hypothetical protein
VSLPRRMKESPDPRKNDLFARVRCGDNTGMKLVRLSLCLAVMFAFLGLGGFALVRWGVPKRPYGTREYDHASGRFATVQWDRTANPLSELQRETEKPFWIRERYGGPVPILSGSQP